MGSKSSHEPRLKSEGSGRVHRYSRVHQGGVNCLAASPAKHTVITGGSDGNATHFNYATGKVTMYLRHEGKPVTAIAGTAGGVVSGCRDTHVRLWRESSPTVFAGHTLVVTAVAVSPDSGRILSGSRDNCIKAWDVQTVRAVCSVAESRNLVTGLCLHDNMLVQTSEDKKVRVWDSRTLQLTHTYPTKHYIQTCCDVDPHGNTLVTGSNGFSGSGCEVSVWDVRGKKEMLCELRGHEQGVNCVSFLPGSPNVVVSGSKDSVVKLWDISRRECILEKRLPGMGAVTDFVCEERSIMCSTSNGCVLLTLSDNNTLSEVVCF